MHGIQPTKFLKSFKALYRGPWVNQWLFSVSKKSALKQRNKSSLITQRVSYRQTFAKNCVIQNIKKNYNFIFFFC